MDAWGRHIRQVISELAATVEPFTSDDVLDKVGVPDSEHTPNSVNSAVGKAFAEASSRGTIEAVGMVKSRQPSRKGGGIRVWRGVESVSLF